jgi:hypothetical protein
VPSLESLSACYPFATQTDLWVAPNARSFDEMGISCGLKDSIPVTARNDKMRDTIRALTG